jgi:protoporphyrinogen oxidase
VGHKGRVQLLDLAIADAFGGRLQLAGNSFEGVGVASAIDEGNNAALRVLHRLSGRYKSGGLGQLVNKKG